ncbi:MAG: C25 family cysteine peptidase [bacterium]|nr:C25 family cysteine peptidase [bacterium]
MKQGFALAAMRSTAAVCLLYAAPQLAIAQDPTSRTLAEFEEYVAGKLPDLEKAQLAKIAKAADKNADGKIDADEFGDRMAAVRAVMTGAFEEVPEVRRGAPTEPPKKPTVEPRSPATGSKVSAVLLITGADLAEAWYPFAEWKTQNGKPTKIMTVSQIRGEYEGGIVQEQIRRCVRDHVDNFGTRWVVLGGDCTPDGGLVPGGHTTVHAQEREGIPTDIVYLSPTDWDGDGDGIHGEWEDDKAAITYPDGSVGLGRVPVRTAADVAAFTAKVIEFESDYPTDGFATQMVYTCTDQPAYAKVRKSWDGHVHPAWRQGEVARFFSKETPWDNGEPGSHDLSSANLLTLFNQKSVGKVHIHGHGMLPFWVLERSKFTSKHVAELDHRGAYPLITTVSCFTGQYDGAEDPSIVESMLRQPGGGSVAIVAPVRTGKPHFHSRRDFRLMVREGKLDGTTQTMTRYWARGLGDGLTTGESLMHAKAAMIPDAEKTPGYHLCICELNLLGDPTLDMRADTPKRPQLEVPESLATGGRDLTVSAGAAGATVCVWMDDQVYVVGTADENGKATLSIAPERPGTMLVTATGRGLNSVTRKVRVVERK